MSGEQQDYFESISHLRDDYKKLLKAALKDGLLAVSAAKNSGKYIGTYHEYPSLSFNKNGLPSLSSTYGTGPTDYRNCFSSYGGEPIVNEDGIQSFNELVEFVRSHEQLLRRFSIHVPFSMSSEPKIEFDRIQIISGIKDCIERYIHKFYGVEYSHKKALEAVEPTVSYVFDSSLKIDISVPILFLNFPFDEYKLANGISIERITDADHMARYKVKSFNTSTHQSVVNSATHALVLKDWCVPNSENMWNFNVLSNAGAYPIGLIDQFFGALRIVCSKYTGYAQIYSKSKGWEAYCTADLPHLHGATLRSYPSWFENFHWNTETVPVVSSKTVEETKLLFNKIQSASENAIDLALRRLNRCHIRDDEEDAVLDATIALEALLSDGNQEMTHKLALRVGALLKLDDVFNKTPAQAFEDIKRIYSYRSAIVHGSKNIEKKRVVKVTDEKKTTAHDLVVDYLRVVLRIILKNEKFRDPRHIDEVLLLGLNNYVPEGLNP